MKIIYTVKDKKMALTKIIQSIEEKENNINSIDVINNNTNGMQKR